MWLTCHRHHTQYKLPRRPLQVLSSTPPRPFACFRSDPHTRPPPFSSFSFLATNFIDSSRCRSQQCENKYCAQATQQLARAVHQWGSERQRTALHVQLDPINDASDHRALFEVEHRRRARIPRNSGAATTVPSPHDARDFSQLGLHIATECLPKPLTSDYFVENNDPLFPQHARSSLRICPWRRLLHLW